MTARPDLPAWTALTRHQTASFELRSLLAQPGRMAGFTHEVGGVYFDFSKHLATPETLSLLTDLARACDVEIWRDRMFAGEKINTTEKRAVLHTALRSPEKSGIVIDGEDALAFIHAGLDKMTAFSDRVRSGVLKGYSGKAFTDIVNIGIGGSDLGPRFVCEALQDYHDGPAVHFVSNVDGAAMVQVLERINPETTLFIVASKTFTTEETMLNASVARDWLIAKSGSAAAVSSHFVALSTNEKDVAAFGIAPDNMFPFREWVGGRYSLWSPIGLSIMLAIGAQNFRAMLAGAYVMDTHFRTAPLDKNVPVLMALLGVWYRNFWDYPAHLLLPYDVRLARIAKYTQQMDMESNGKSVDRDGNAVTYPTSPFIFGEPGTDSQHSYMQLVHQGTTPIPADFIVCKKPHHHLTANHTSLLANCMAQSLALAAGQTLDEAGGDPFRVFSGNRPSTTIVLPELSPATLGTLLAAYEQKVFVQGILWNLNSFDQPGVELGKKLAKPITVALNGKEYLALDASTEALIKYLKV